MTLRTTSGVMIRVVCVDPAVLPIGQVHQDRSVGEREDARGGAARSTASFVTSAAAEDQKRAAVAGRTSRIGELFGDRSDRDVDGAFQLAKGGRAGHLRLRLLEPFALRGIGMCRPAGQHRGRRHDVSHFEGRTQECRQRMRRLSRCEGRGCCLDTDDDRTDPTEIVCLRARRRP